MKQKTGMTVEDDGVDLPIGTGVIEEVSLDKIAVDHRVQRARFNKAKLNKMIAEFDASALGVWTLSRRPNGRFIVLDGWHRSEACKVVANAPTTIRAEVFDDLTLAQEAKLFRLHNTRAPMHVVDMFNAQTYEGQAAAVRITKIVEKHGGKVSTDNYAAIKTAIRICELPNGFELFDQALNVVEQAWTLTKRSTDGRIVEGIAMFLYYYKERVRAEVLIKKLQEQGAEGHHDILATAGPYFKAKGGRFAIAVVDVLTGMYNKGKRSDKLPDYQR
jgi:hypothetical protein